MAHRNLQGLAEVVREEMVVQDLIRDLLKKEPLTIPQLAESLGAPSWQVMAWLMAMRRYGQIKELPKSRADDYYQYTSVLQEEV